MLIVRHLKGLSVNLLKHLENSACWLMEVSMFRILARHVTGASRAHGRTRVTGDGGEEPGPLDYYDRDAVQWRTVARMLNFTRESGFLDVSHRYSEWLTHVFSRPVKGWHSGKTKTYCWISTSTASLRPLFMHQRSFRACLDH